MTEQVKTPVFTLAQLATAIEAMAKAQQASANSIAKVIVMVAFAANAGIDGKPSAEPANSMFKNLRRGVKKDAIVALLQEKCNLAYVSGAWTLFDAGKGWTEQEVKDIKAAAATWESYKKAPDPEKEVDVIESFEDFVQKLTRQAAKKGKLGHQEMLPKLQALLGAIKGEVLMDD